jgi:hypothetical protein
LSKDPAAKPKAKLKPKKVKAKTTAHRKGLNDKQRAFIKLWPKSFNYDELVPVLGVSKDTLKHWNSRAINPEIKELIDAEIVKHFDKVKGRLEILFAENKERIFGELWDIYEKAKGEQDWKNCLRALEKLTKIVGMDVVRTEITGAKGEPLAIRVDDSEVSFEGWEPERISAYISMRREANALAKAQADGKRTP